MNAQDLSLTVYSQQEETCADELFREHYETLLQIARQRRRRHAVGNTLQTTALVHEAFIKLADREAFADDDHFLRSSALAIRHVIVDYARAKLTARRGSGASAVPIKEELAEFREKPEQIIEIADLLGRLGEKNPRWLKIVDARYFAGMTEEETARVYGLSERTVRRDWKEAREWIKGALKAA